MIVLSAAIESAPFIDRLTELDKNLFTLINSHWVSGFCDFLLPILRNPKTWIPLYLLLFLYAAFKWKFKSWSWVMMAVVCITLSDQFSSHLLKGLFDRLRPCQDFAETVRLLVDRCPDNASFPSSHAVNHFAIGTYFMISLKPYFRRWSYLFLGWAAAICYAQVYVGVHYPSDVLGGAVIGVMIGLLVAFVFKRYFNFGQTKKQLN